MKYLLLLALCLTTAQVKNEVCRLICRNESYDTGYYLKTQKACLCGVIKKYEDIEEKTLLMPKQSKNKPKERNLEYEY